MPKPTLGSKDVNVFERNVFQLLRWSLDYTQYNHFHISIAEEVISNVQENKNGHFCFNYKSLSIKQTTLISGKQ